MYHETGRSITSSDLMGRLIFDDGDDDVDDEDDGDDNFDGDSDEDDNDEADISVSIC